MFIVDGLCVCNDGSLAARCRWRPSIGGSDCALLYPSFCPDNERIIFIISCLVCHCRQPVFRRVLDTLFSRLRLVQGYTKLYERDEGDVIRTWSRVKRPFNLRVITRR